MEAKQLAIHKNQCYQSNHLHLSPHLSHQSSLTSVFHSHTDEIYEFYSIQVQANLSQFSRFCTNSLPLSLHLFTHQSSTHTQIRLRVLVISSSSESQLSLVGLICFWRTWCAVASKSSFVKHLLFYVWTVWPIFEELDFKTHGKK